METILKWISALDTTVIAILNGVFLFWFRKQDMKKIDEQIKHLESQAETAKEHVSILWEEKRIRDLGPNLKVVIDGKPYAYRSGKDFLIDINVIIKNPTKYSIKMNNFQIDKKSPFAFVEGGSIDHVIAFTPENEKYMGFESPFRADLNSQDICGYFSLKRHEKALFTLTVRHLKPNIETVPIFIIEHTSSNHPERVVQTKFWPSFFLSFEE
ncbi:hypothetical protein [Bartonella sp. CM31XJBT]|uniref:hypothetical protein n=1 Tax=Bartonella sp. CM31XJBT TaxID=3019090 RepID=UPI0023616310|nr:hypothetical protein [Bartonella sp. CM31XJBT]